MDCRSQKQQTSVCQLGLCGKFMTVPQGPDSNHCPFLLPSYISVEIKTLLPVLGNDFLFFLLSALLKTKKAT